jgi:xyloglucan-specific endo-beta-1,4-glucanase
MHCPSFAVLSVAATVSARHIQRPGHDSLSSSSIAVASATPVTAETVSTVATSTAVAVDTVSAVTATKFCGAPNAYQVISNTPWIVYSMNYNYEDISGSCCTNYYDYTGTGDNQTIHWSSVWDIDESVSTDVVKGYSFIGLTQNLETQLSAISSIPSTYQWTISNTTAYKGKKVEVLEPEDLDGPS